MLQESELLGELIFIGLGLNRETDISVNGLEKARSADAVFAEFYTSLMPDLDTQRLEELVGKPIRFVTRNDLEEEEGRTLLTEAERGKVVLLTPGDPLIATTHVDLRMRAHRKGIKTGIVHGASIISAVIGLSGLQNYKFGRSVTIPFADSKVLYETPYNVIAENRKMRLHTLCFLDIKADKKRYMTVNEGLRALLDVERHRKKGVIKRSTLLVGVARAGSENPTVKADFAEKLLRYDFGGPPHSLIYPGELHFIEAEALITLANAPEKVKEMVK